MIKQSSIKTILEQPGNQLTKLMAKVNKLNELNQYLSDILPLKLAKHCKIANFTGDELVLVVDNSTWATRIRYMSPDLVEKFREIPELQQINSIKTIIRADIKKDNKQQEEATKPQLSKENAQFILSVAKNIKDKKLKEALLRLAENA